MIIKNMLLKPDEATRGQKAVALSIATISNTALTVILQMIIARLYTKTEAASYNQGILVYNTIYPLIQMGVNSGIYYRLVRDKDRARAIMTEGIIITLFMGGVFSLFLLAGGNALVSDILNNPGLNSVLYFIIPYILICVPETVALVGFVYTNRIRFSSWYSIIKSLICVSVLICVALVQQKGTVLLINRIFIQCILGILTIVIVYKFLFPKDNSHIRLKSMKELAVVSVPLGFASLMGTVYSSLDGWIISRMCGAEVYSAFKMGAGELPFVGIITGAVSTVMIVDITTAINDEKYESAISLFRNMADRTSQLLMPIMVFFLFASKNFVSFLYTTKYLDAVPFFIVYLFYIPVHTVIYGPIMIALGKSKVILIRDMIAFALNAVLSIILVMQIGAIGASIATILVTYFYSVPFDVFAIGKWCGIKWNRVLPFRRMAEYVIYSVPGALAAYGIDILFSNAFSYFWRLVIMFFIYTPVTIFIFRIKFRISYLRMIRDILVRKREGRER